MVAEGVRPVASPGCFKACLRPDATSTKYPSEHPSASKSFIGIRAGEWAILRPDTGGVMQDLVYELPRRPMS